MLCFGITETLALLQIDDEDLEKMIAAVDEATCRNMNPLMPCKTFRI